MKSLLEKLESQVAARSASAGQRFLDSLNRGEPQTDAFGRVVTEISADQVEICIINTDTRFAQTASEFRKSYDEAREPSHDDQPQD